MRQSGARLQIGGLTGGTRTPDLLLRRQLLYPVELRSAKSTEHCIRHLGICYGLTVKDDGPGWLGSVHAATVSVVRQDCSPIVSGRRGLFIVAATTEPMDGRSREIRTPDPLVPNQMRYQTALCSEGMHCNRQWPCLGLWKRVRGFLFLSPGLPFPAAACTRLFDFHGGPYEQGQADAQRHLLQGQRLGFEDRLQERDVDNGHLQRKGQSHGAQ